MISYPEALDSIRKQISPLGTEKIPLNIALNRVLSEDISSLIDMPPFNQSAMDGYAVRLHSSQEFKVIGEMKAGDSAKYVLETGEAVRIFTGAMVPESADCVVRQEIVTRSDNSIHVNEIISSGENIRPQGEQIRKGETAIQHGAKLTPGTIGYLATIGYDSVPVYKQPRIALIATGNELQTTGAPLESGKIYESNTVMIQTALQQLGLDCSIHFVKDDYNATRDKISELLDSSDLLLLTGGISVGDYDFVERALSELNVTNHFYKVKQKPGKPLFFGSKNDGFVFALPGNPAAALTCFYVYIREALDRLQNTSTPSTEGMKLPIYGSYSKKKGLTHFLKAKIQNGKVHILPAQSSAMLSAFSEANCLMLADENCEEWTDGDFVTAISLPR